MWRITERLNTLHQANWTAEVAEIVDNFTVRVIAEVGNGYSGSDTHEKQWSFPGALLYSITVITTIGRKCECSSKCRISWGPLGVTLAKSCIVLSVRPSGERSRR